MKWFKKLFKKKTKETGVMDFKPIQIFDEKDGTRFVELDGVLRYVDYQIKRIDKHFIKNGIPEGEHYTQLFEMIKKDFTKIKEKQCNKFELRQI